MYPWILFESVFPNPARCDRRNAEFSFESGIRDHKSHFGRTRGGERRLIFHDTAEMQNWRRGGVAFHLEGVCNGDVGEAVSPSQLRIGDAITTLSDKTVTDVKVF